MIFHLEEEKYRDHASAFQLSRSIEGHKNLEVKTQGKSEAQLRENVKMYILSLKYVNCSWFQMKLLGPHVFVCWSLATSGKSWMHIIISISAKVVGQSVGPEGEGNADCGPLVAQQGFLRHATINDNRLPQDQALQEHDNQLGARSPPSTYHDYTIFI